MKITHNDDGTITVMVPKADEVYDAPSGELYIPFVTTKEDVRALLRKPEADKVEDPA